ncbi:diguanylate cyclase [Clostridium septicum]|uniref:tetratricopeptide repeat-containing diguanylate cyclase n=1 Tax=Clostridium septicum TaxID=1504 RepID=UPI00321633E7
MGKIKEIKNKGNLLKLAIIIACILSLTTFINIKNARFTSYENVDSIKQALKLIEENKESTMYENRIIEYYDAIKNEVEVVLSDEEKEKGYYALGYIEYINENYEESNEYLFKALNYRRGSKNKTKILIYNYIANNYLALGNLKESQRIFNIAEKMAIDNKHLEELIKIYRERAIALVNFRNGVNDGIELLKKSLDVKQDDISIAETNILLSKMYLLINNFHKSLKSDIKVLKISIEDNYDDFRIKGCINLATNYYLQEKYEDAINIYEKVLKEAEVLDLSDELTTLMYSSACYEELGMYDKAYAINDKILKKSANIVGLNKKNILKRIYNSYANLNLKQGNIEVAEDYINKAKEIASYTESYIHNGLDLITDNIEIGIMYKKGTPYEEVLKAYKNLHERVSDIGINFRVYNLITKSVIEISKENNDEETAIEYLDKNVKAIDFKNKSNLNINTDYIISKIKNDSISKHLNKLRVGSSIMLLITGIFLVAFYIIYNKNRKINILNSELETLSLTDELTGLANKRFLFQELEYMINGKSITFIMLDVDCFKEYNDNYGHIEGDKVLKQVADIIRAVFHDEITCRFGGEEFSIISKEPKDNVIEKIKELMEKLNDLNIKHSYSKVSDRITISVGIESSTLHSKDEIMSLLKATDEKLYVSKKCGRNTYTY